MLVKWITPFSSVYEKMSATAGCAMAAARARTGIQQLRSFIHILRRLNDLGCSLAYNRVAAKLHWKSEKTKDSNTCVCLHHLDQGCTGVIQGPARVPDTGTRSSGNSESLVRRTSIPLI